MPVPVHAMNSYLTCDVCVDGGHSGNDCPETREDAAYINNNNNTGFRPQEGQVWGQSRPPFQGGGNNYNSNFNSNFKSNQPSLRDLVFGQAKINESLNKKLVVNDKILESIHAKVETHLSLSHFFAARKKEQLMGKNIQFDFTNITRFELHLLFLFHHERHKAEGLRRIQEDDGWKFIPFSGWLKLVHTRIYTYTKHDGL